MFELGSSKTFFLVKMERTVSQDDTVFVRVKNRKFIVY